MAVPKKTAWQPSAKASTAAPRKRVIKKLDESMWDAPKLGPLKPKKLPKFTKAMFKKSTQY